MIVNRVQLLDELSSVRHALSSKDRVDQSTDFIFVDGKVAAYNEALLIVGKTALTELKGAIHAEELLALLGRLKEDQITVSVDGGFLRLQSGRSKASIRFEESIRIPLGEIMREYADGDGSLPIPEGFLSELKLASFCASKSYANMALTGVSFSGGKIEATDGYRAFQKSVPFDGISSFLIPAAHLSLLDHVAPTHMKITHGWAFFSSEATGIVFCIRLLSHSVLNTFPSLDSIFQGDGEDIFLPKDILDVLDKADIFLRSLQHEADRLVRISLKDGYVTIRGEGVFGWYEESVPSAEYTGKPLEFLAHPQFLRWITPMVQAARLLPGRIIFSGEGFLYVFALGTSNE